MRVVPANCSVIMVSARCPLLKPLTQTDATSGSVDRSKKNRVHSRVPPPFSFQTFSDSPAMTLGRTRTSVSVLYQTLWNRPALPFLPPSRTLRMSLTSDMTHGRSAPFSWEDPQPAVRQPHYRGAHTLTAHRHTRTSPPSLAAPLHPSLSPPRTSPTWPDPAIVGADPFPEEPSANLKFLPRGATCGLDGGGGGGGVRRDIILPLIALN